MDRIYISVDLSDLFVDPKLANGEGYSFRTTGANAEFNNSKETLMGGLFFFLLIFFDSDHPPPHNQPKPWSSTLVSCRRACLPRASWRENAST